MNIQHQTLKWFFGVGLLLVFFPVNVEALVPPATAPTTTVRHRGDPDIQQKRLVFIKKAISVGYITAIEDNRPITRVRVGRNFISLSTADKEDILNVVWSYYKTEDPQKNVVLVIDGSSGKEIGEYSPAQGGLKMK